MGGLSSSPEPEQNLPDLPELIAGINRFIGPALLAASKQRQFAHRRGVTGGWTAARLTQQIGSVVTPFSRNRPLKIRSITAPATSAILS